MNPRDLFEEIEDELRKEGFLHEDEDLFDTPDPPRLVVELGPDHHAVFTGEPENSLRVFKADTKGHVELPYFDPGGFTQDDLIRRLRLLLTFG